MSFSGVPETDPAVDVLLQDYQAISKYPDDGIVDFHSIKFCTSNAKTLSAYFQSSMGFKEIAYRGLETGNYYLSSHVVSNGKFKIEILSPLHSHLSDLDLVSSSTYLYSLGFEDDILRFVERELNSFMRIYGEKLQVDGGLVKESILQKLHLVDDFEASSNDISKRISVAGKLIRERLDLIKVQDFIARHSDGVMDVSFKVEDTRKSFDRAVQGGAIPISQPYLSSDIHGSCYIAVVGVPGTDIQHSFIQDIDYSDMGSGPFLPDFKVPIHSKSSDHLTLLKDLPSTNLVCLDHCVFNFTWNQMMPYARFYASAFGFHKFWSVDEEDVSTMNTSLKSIVMASSNGNVKIPINEPGEGKKRGQIEEFYDFNEGPGIQHLALRTDNIVDAVRSLNKRGIEFNTMHQSYYTDLQARMTRDNVKINEDMQELEKLNILVDYDANSRNEVTKTCNYILQIFTKPFSDRPTLFIEIIQRNNHNGFGKGTFKGLFQSIEAQQELRGTLTDRV